MFRNSSAEPRYAVITAARNEAGFIPGLVAALSDQTVKPRIWIVVVDNSSDATERVVSEAAATRPWIRVMTNPNDAGLGFGSKVAAVMAAYDCLRHEDFDFVASIDADTTFPPAYCESILREFEADAALGVAGSAYTEGETRFLTRRLANYADVPGGCQFFRRACFDAIGGYEPMPRGGEDTIASVRARMLGWRTAVIPGLSFDHRRPVGRGGRGNLAASVMLGERAYHLGGHPVWESLAAATHLRREPLVLGTVFELFGYWRAMFSRAKRDAAPDVVTFRRAEQLKRIRSIPAALVEGRLSGRPRDSA